MNAGMKDMLNVHVEIPEHGHAARRSGRLLQRGIPRARSIARNWGICQRGAAADVAVLRMVKGEFGFVDSARLRMRGTRKLVAR